MTALLERPLSRPSPRRQPSLRQALLALFVSVLAFGIVRASIPHTILGDLHVYRAEGMAIRHGADLYAHLPGVRNLATYPPFAAVVFVVLTPVPIAALQVLCLIVNFGLLVLVCALSCRLVGVSGRAAVVPVALFSAVALWSEPVFTTFAYGQINLLLLALVLWDFTRREGSPLRGIGTGLAAGMKVTPAILIVYLVLTKRYRAAATATGTFAATIGLSALVDPHGARAFWTHDLFDLQRVGNVEDSVNQTVRGMLVRLDHTRSTRPTELVLILLVLVAGLVIARAAHRLLGDAWGLPACAVTGLLTSPIAWTHHWIWVVPIAILLWFRARAWLIPTMAIFSTFAVWIVPHVHTPQLRLTPVEIACSGLYVLFGFGFLALTARRSWVAGRCADSGDLVAFSGP